MVPGDYDGDSQMDVLLTAQISSETAVFIFWGHNQTLGRGLIVMDGGQRTQIKDLDQSFFMSHIVIHILFFYQITGLQTGLP